MQLTKIKIKNYRLLVNAELEVDPKTTLIVGRNNTAKTSCFSTVKFLVRSTRKTGIYNPHIRWRAADETARRFVC